MVKQEEFNTAVTMKEEKKKENLAEKHRELGHFPEDS